MNCDQITEEHVDRWLHKAGIGPNEVSFENLDAMASDILGHASSPTARAICYRHANRITRKVLRQYAT